MSRTPAFQQHLDRRRSGRAAARHDDLQVFDSLADHQRRVHERGENDDRRSVLVVVHDRMSRRSIQASLDFETARGGDVLEIDPAEDGRDSDDRLDDLVHVFGVQADRKGIDVRELLEEHRFALHHRQRAQRSDVAQPEHGRPVADDRDGVALDRELKRLGRVRAIAIETRATPGV